MLKVVFQFKNQGKAGFIKHAKTKTHKHTADGINNRLTGQQSFTVRPSVDDENNTDLSGEEEPEDGGGGGAGGDGEDTEVHLEVARGQDGDNAVEVGGTIIGDRLVKYDRGGGRTRRKVKRH